MNKEFIPLVSIVVTSYNQPELLKEACYSVLNQTYKNIEIIIADDCSTNMENIDFIKKIQLQHPNIVKSILHPTNIGIAKNKNSGFRACSGEYITYLDGDDVYFPNKIEEEIKRFEKDSTLSVVFSNFSFTNPQGVFQSLWNEKAVPEGEIFSDVVKEQFPGTILFRFELMNRKVFEQCGYYRERLLIYEDWDFRIRYASRFKIGYADNIGSIYRRNSNSITVNSNLSKLISQKKEVLILNKELIDNRPELKVWLKKCLIGLDLEILFDVEQKSLKVFLRKALLLLIKYPHKLFAWSKAVKYYLKNYFQK